MHIYDTSSLMRKNHYLFIVGLGSLLPSPKNALNTSRVRDPALDEFLLLAISMYISYGVLL